MKNWASSVLCSRNLVFCFLFFDVLFAFSVLCCVALNSNCVLVEKMQFASFGFY